MRLWIKTLFKDILAVSLLLSLFYFAGKNYLEIIGNKIRGQGDPIGVVSDLSYYPKRQLDGDSYTHNLSLSDDLFEGDAITSDAFSSILMNLIDGTEISLENGSRIILRLEENTIYFDGTISALATSERPVPLQLINLNEKNAQPIILNSSSEITVSTDEKGVFNLSVLNGEVSRGEEIIEENEQFTLTPEGETEVNRLNFILTSPPNNSNWVTFDESLSLRFTWDEPVIQEKRTLQVALDTSFNRIVYIKEDIQDQSYELELLPGDYFWRVGNPENEEYSTTAKVKIMENRELYQISPAQGVNLTYRNQNPSQTFRWGGTESAVRWLFTISPNRDMTSPLINETVQYNQIKIDGLEEGEYWWQVTALYEEFENVRQRLTPSPRSFSVSRITQIAPPLLLTPDGEETLSSLTLSQGTRFSWKGDDEIESYELVISDRNDLTDPLFRDRTLKNYLSVNTSLDEGVYYWQVRPQSQNESIPPSEIRSFEVRNTIREIKPIYPAPDEPVVMERGQSLLFRWDSTERENFRFRLWQKRETEEKLIANTLVNPIELSQFIPDEGEYLWQVDLVNSRNELIQEGPRQTFYVRYPFLPPSLTFPQPDSRLSLIGEDSIILSWNRVDKSIGYNLRLYRDSRDDLLWQADLYGETKAEIKTSMLTPGEYLMEIQSVRQNEGLGYATVSETSVSRFYLDDVIIYQAPRIISPSPGSVVNRLDLLQRGALIEWDSSYDFPQYQITLRDADSRGVIMQRISPVNSFGLTSLFPGRYEIEVRGRDTSGRLSPGATTTLIVTEVESLAAPVIRFPAAGDQVDMSERDTLDFLWTHEEEGVLYNLALRDNSGRLIFSRLGYGENSYVFGDLSLLDVGQFIFTIEGVKEYSDLGIVRTSPLASIPFTITLKEIETAPVILSPDVQYAD